MKGATVSKVESWVKQNRITTLRHQGKLVIDVDASEEVKEAEVGENQVLSPEVLLQRLLLKAETSAQKSDISRKKWQLVSFVSLMLLAVTLYTVIWMNMEVNALSGEQGRLRIDKRALAGQVRSANTKASEASERVELLRNQNERLAIENISLREQNRSLFSKVESLNRTTDIGELKYAKDKPRGPEKKWHQTEDRPQVQSRLNTIQEGIYPKDMTKDELIASLGEPDRVYKGEVYEQLLYLGRSPGRFWFKNGPFLDATTE